MALNPYALTSVARLKEFMGITTNTHDTILERIIDSMTEYVEQYCDRRFRLTSYNNEEYNGSGSSQLLLRNYPINTFTTLEKRDTVKNENNWTAFETEDFFVDTDIGIITLVSSLSTQWPRSTDPTSAVFSKFPLHYRVTYVAGYDFNNIAGAPTLETAGIGDLEYAMWKICAEAFNQRKGSDNVISEKIGEYSVTFRKELVEDEEVGQILANYRRPHTF